MPAKRFKIKDSIFIKKIVGYDPRDPDCQICGGSGVVVFAPSKAEIQRGRFFENRDYGRCLCVNPYHVKVKSSLRVVLERGWQPEI